MTKTQQRAADKARILAALDKSDKFVERALLALYDRQTADEQRAGTTQEDNGIGFAGNDSDFLSSVSAWVLRGRAKGIPEGKCLTLPQRVAVRKRLARYTRQLIEHAETVKPTRPQIQMALH